MMDLLHITQDPGQLKWTSSVVTLYCIKSIWLVCSQPVLELATASHLQCVRSYKPILPYISPIVQN